MTFDLWLKDKFPDTTKFDAADMEAAWDAAAMQCLLAVAEVRQRCEHGAKIAPNLESVQTLTRGGLKACEGIERLIRELRGEQT